MTYLDVQYSEARQPKTDFPEELIAMLREKLGLYGDEVLLDVGCGRGDFTEAWNGGRYLSNRQKASGMDRLGNPTYRAKADGEWPVPQGSLDVVFSKSTIEHLDNPYRMLFEAYAALRCGGKVVVMTPDWRTYQLTFWDDYTHRQPFDVVSMRDILIAAGFQCVTSEVIYQYPAAWRSPTLRALFTLWRWFVPLRFSLWLCDKTGLRWPKWASQLTVLASGIKP